MTLAELRKAGMVVDGAAPVANRRGGAGRPATAVMLNPEAGTVVGLLIGLEHIQLIVADVSHAVLADKKVELEVDFSPDQAMAIVQRLVREAYEELDISTDTMLGIGVAIGGPINPTNGRLIRAGAIPTWEGVDVCSLFETALERPIYADNVSKCWAIAEMMWGAAHGVEDFVYMLVDLGVAGAIVSRGHVIDGVAGAAGEFGHITIDPKGDLCRCGNRGCLELYAGFKAATMMASRRFGRPMGIMDVIALARKGDVGCRRLIEDTAEMAGRGLAIVGAAINPGLILIGGRLAMAGSMFFEPLEASFDKYSLVKRNDVGPDARTRIVPAKMLENGACMGAVGLVLRHYGRR
jgi:predicted NBD/HSP70 family sugar kinase